MVDDEISVEERKRRLRVVGFVGALGNAFFVLLLWLFFPDFGDFLYVLTAVMIGSAVYLLWLMLVFFPRRMDRRQS